MPSKGQKIQGSEKTRSTGRPVITASQAQAAFNRFYKRTQHKRRGTKGKFFASSKGRLSAMKYDKNHTGKRVVSDSRYLTASGPYRYDFQGVDTGSKVRAALSSNQLKVLKAARDKLAAKLAALRKPACVLPVKPKRVLPVKPKRVRAVKQKKVIPVLPKSRKRWLPKHLKRLLPATPKSSVKPKRVLPATPKAGCKVVCRQKAGSQKAGSQKAGSQKAGSQKAGSQKAGSQKAGSQKAGSQKAGSQKAGSQKAGSQKAGSQKAGSQKAGGKVTGTFSVPRQVAGYWW